MPVLTPEMITLTDRGQEAVISDPDKKIYNALAMDRYAIEAIVDTGLKREKLFRLIPNASRPLWDAQDRAFVEQLKALFISQYIAGEWVVVE